MFVESLAEAMDLRERETGLHSKRVAAHTLLLARHFFLKEEGALREMTALEFHGSKQPSGTLP